MDYQKLAKRLQTAPDCLLFPGRKTALFFSGDNDAYLIFYSSHPESEPQNPIEGWHILKDVPDPQKKGQTIIICHQ